DVPFQAHTHIHPFAHVTASSPMITPTDEQHGTQAKQCASRDEFSQTLIPVEIGRVIAMPPLPEPF
ncbi:hypothetical protein GGI11_008566, partial [Coemansia sp. RSA 2049]